MAFAPEDLILISVDDHIIEPPNLFDAHLPERYKADAPRIVRRDDGADVMAVRRSRGAQRGPQRGRRTAQGGIRRRAPVAG